MNTNSVTKKISIFWFRRDLRLEDNKGLYHALTNSNPVLGLFIFDTKILDKLEDDDARVTFIHQELERINRELKDRGSSLKILIGEPVQVWKQLISEFQITEVYLNRDYEPYAVKRDSMVKDLLEGHGIAFRTFKDQVIFEKDEVLKKDGTPYTVYTPFSKVWKNLLRDNHIKSFASEKLNNWLDVDFKEVPSLYETGFVRSQIKFPERKFNAGLIKKYHETRDFPGIDGTTKLSVHLRFGTISIRKLFSAAINLNQKFLNELIWREFYFSILWHFPHTVDQNFNRKYDVVIWRNNEKEFEKWCKGQTGYPIVDAGMRELNETGYMHNRVRMIVASFLTKHLLIDWRWGEAYFAGKLLDYEQANNVGGWQWAAGTGVDAAPYFRIFNPYLQEKKFDPDNKYVSKWVPESDTLDYPEPVVDHTFARERALKAYQEALDSQ